MKIIIEKNDELESYRLIDQDSDQSHDGDNSKEVIADVYTENNAYLIKKLFNNLFTKYKELCINDVFKCLDNSLIEKNKKTTKKKIKWKLKENAEVNCGGDGFWYDLTLGGYINPKNILSDKEQLETLEKAIKIVQNFEAMLEEKFNIDEY